MKQRERGLVRKHTEAVGETASGFDLARHVGCVVPQGRDRVQLRSDRRRIEAARERIVEHLPRLVELSQLQVGARQIRVWQRLVRCKSDGRAELLGRLLPFTEPLVRDRDVHARHELVGIGLNPHAVGVDRLRRGVLDRRVVPRHDVEALGLAHLLAQRVGLSHFLARQLALAQIAVDGAEPRVREREVGILFDGFPEERERRPITLAAPRGERERVRLQRVERRRRGALDRRVVFLHRRERLAQPSPQLPRRRSQRLQHVVLVRRLNLRFLDRVAGPAVGRVERDHVARAELGDRAAEHRFARGALTQVAGDVARQLVVGPPAHEAQRALHALLRQHADVRRLPQLHVERLLQRVVEHRLARRVREVGDHDGVALAEGARAGRVEENAGDRRDDDRGRCSDGFPRKAAQ